MTLARIAAVASGGVVLTMAAALATIIRAAIRCDEALDAYDWTEDDGRWNWWANDDEQLAA